MSKKLLIALLIITSTITIAFAEEMSDDVKEGELVQKYTEEYIDLEEAKRLGLETKKVEEVEEEVIENHKKLEKPQILQKN